MIALQGGAVQAMFQSAPAPAGAGDFFEYPGELRIGWFQSAPAPAGAGDNLDAIQFAAA